MQTARIVPRGPGFSDPLMVHILPPAGRPVSEGDEGLLKSDLMCKDTQTKPDPDKSRRLQAAAGDFVALRYQENGHVTLPQNQLGKAPNRGTVFIYGTSEPSETDTFLAIHKQWNSAGTGGDKRGKLLATQDFDDSQCYQVNGGDISASRQKEFPHQFDALMGGDIWCQNNIALPSDLPVGKPYTLYWVWDWGTLPNIDPGLPDGKVEIYTTCMDIDIAGSADKSGFKAITNIQQKNIDTAPSADNAILNSAAIPKYMDELRKLAVAPKASAEPASQPSPSPSPSPSQAPESSQSSTSEAPQNQVTVTVTEKPAVVATTVTVMVTKSPTTTTPPTTTVTLPQSTLTVVDTTVTRTIEPSGTFKSFTGTVSALPSSAEFGNSADVEYSRRCVTCKKHKRSRIVGGARHRH